MNNPVKAYGRMELAQAYFPFLKPKSAWEKLRSVMLDDERLSQILQNKRRTFMPIEVSQIFAVLGSP